ncbi:carboxypeptidase regulatory-like domain-containing protein, partial [Candidatus Sumerlaeota bacterium]|nr:carboxypeptidase regulatory-like domain-containing protein [Candidatus Sumerlaeota bacterium]
KRGSVIGIGAYLQSSIQNSMDQLAWARAQGAAGLNIYDWYSEVDAASGATRAQFYSELKSQLYPTWADPPQRKWKTEPTTGLFEGNLTYKGLPIDHGTVRIAGQPETMTYTDGSGWYAILEVSPGSHILEFSKPGRSDAFTSATIPTAGDIITVNMDLFRAITAWMNY